MSELWTKEKEIEFFKQSLENFAEPEQLFYISDEGKYYAYWPKSYKGKKSTLQSRNALIGNFTEKYSVDLLQHFSRERDLYAVQGIICEEIGLTPQSPSDVAICKLKKREQKAEDIVAIFEVKMSIVWNWEYKDGRLICIGDYKTHQGSPGLLRSDSMLKAIGKSINIRVLGYKASKIPIIILGNTPITESYFNKVDHLKKAGIIQGFWSINPNPLDNNGENIKSTKHKGFIRFDSIHELYNTLDELLIKEMEFFSSMKSKKELGQIIEIANREATYEQKAEKFLKLIRE
ncbi:hypothetical protein [Desulfonauticus submarinus]